MISTYAPIFIVEIGGVEVPENISSHIESFSYEENEKEMDELKLTITKGDLAFIDNPMLQEGKEIRARWGYLGNLSDVRTCTIKAINYSYSEDGTVKMEISAYDKRHKLTGRAPRQCWNDDDMTYEFMSQGAKNDLVFLSELAKDAGCSVWVVNDELYFKPNKVGEPVYKFRYREDRDGYLRYFRISSKAERKKGRRIKTAAAGVNPLTKKPILEEVTQGSE